MATSDRSKLDSRPTAEFESARQHRSLMRRTLLTLLLTFLAPFLLLTIYFHYQSLALKDESGRNRLMLVAEYQAHMLDLFIRERAVNLANLVDNPRLEIDPSRSDLRVYLVDLKQDSDSFVDVGFFNADGIQVVYEGPFPVLEKRDYGNEPWFQKLRSGKGDFVMTDIYLGFRQRPHFTIAVSRVRGGQFVAIRATLDPEKMYEYISALEGARGVHSSIVNRDGLYQVVTPSQGAPLAESLVVPPGNPTRGTGRLEKGAKAVDYGYAWLTEAMWAVITQDPSPKPYRYVLGGDFRIAAVALVVILLILMATFVSAHRQVQIVEERDQTKAQLEHSAKLASVGELAAGIAHEINNPLAIISEEAGLMQDLMNPEFGRQTTPEELSKKLNNIQTAVFRCRDITRKLLGFVRRTEFQLALQNVPALVDEVVDDFFAREMVLENITIKREYAAGVPKIETDKNQLQQVILNLIKNATDAIEGAGTITISIKSRDNHLRISIADTGRGMSQKQLEKVFMPFFTTKEVGRGTGLGLSVSYGIVQGLGGDIEVRSIQGTGSTFTIVLPLK